MLEGQDERLKRVIKELGELEEVPEATAYRYRSKLNELRVAEKSQKRRWTDNAPWKLVAGLVLIMSLAISLQFATNPNVQVSSPPKSEVTESPKVTSIKPSQNEQNKELPSEPKVSDGPDFSKFEDLEDITLPKSPGFLGTKTIPKVFEECFSLIDTQTSLTFIEQGTYKGEPIIAVWTLKSGKIWEIEIVGRECETKARYRVSE